MILLRSHIDGFGKLRDLTLQFRDGVNLIFAANEGGKSTLQRFLIASLYGQLRSDLKVQRRLDPWVERYKPWYGNEYGGILWCRLADGRDIEIHRSFGKEETRIEIRTASGEDITRQYEQQRNGEVLFARSHFGMPKELFESVGVIREDGVAEIHGYETIRDRIANLAQSGDEELSIRTSLANIQERLESVGSERAPTRPYKQALDQVQSLREERRILQERRLQFQGWIEDRNSVAEEIAKLDQELRRVQSSLLRARRQEIDGRIRMLEEIQGELDGLRNAIESLGGRVDFPSDRLGELNQLVGARDSTARHLAETRGAKDAALVQLAAAESQRQELAAYAPLAAGSDAEKITEWFVSYLSISLQKDGLQKTRNRLAEEAGAVEKRLAELRPAFADPESDWHRLAAEAAEDEQIVSERGSALLARIQAEKASLAEAARSAANRRLLAVLSLIFAAVPPVARFGAGLGGYPYWVDIAITAVFVSIAVFMFYSASKTARAMASGRDVVRTLEAELESVREEGSKKRRFINEAMKSSGFQKLDDFLAASRRAEQDRQKLADLQTRAAEADELQERLQAQSDELYQMLKEGLGKAGLACSPGNLKFQIDVLRANLRRYRELDAGYAACAEKAVSLKSRDAELTREYDATCSRIESLLAEAKVGDPEQFREECARSQKTLELLEKEASRVREFQRLAENLTLEQWREQLRQLMGQRDPLSPGELPEGEAGQDQAEPLLPYLPTIGEMEEQEKQIRSMLAAAREAHAGAIERVKQAFRHFRSESEIEEDLAIAERALGELEKNRQALGIALEAIERLSRQQQEVLAPQLNASVEQRFLRLCGGRYEEVKIDPDFQIWIRESGNGALRLAEHLSRGTQDQLYFSMRFGIMDLVSNAEEPCPGFLDEPFAAYDQERLRKAFEVLADESATRQILLFTCREDLLELGFRNGANIIRLGESSKDRASSGHETPPESGTDNPV